MVHISIWKKVRSLKFKKKTFNLHKVRNLLKEMAIILPNGKIFDFIGPFYSDSKHNDENIWLEIEKKNMGNIKSIFKEKKDEFLGDKGFSRIQNNLFKINHPVVLEKNSKQLTTLEANRSRLVTMLRNANLKIQKIIIKKENNFDFIKIFAINFHIYITMIGNS